MPTHQGEGVLVTQSCLTLCDPMDYNPPGSSVRGILQVRTLEWVAISFSRGSSCPRDWTQVCHIAGRVFTIWATRQAQSIMFFILSINLAAPGLSRSLQDLSCHTWCLTPQPGMEPGALHWEGGILATGPPGKSRRVTPGSFLWLPWGPGSHLHPVSKAKSLHEKSIVIRIITHLHIMHYFSLTVFRYVCLIFSSRNFIIMCPCVDSFEFIFFRTCWIFQICKFRPFNKFGEFSAIQIFFFCITFFIFSFDSIDKC